MRIGILAKAHNNSFIIARILADGTPKVGALVMALPDRDKESLSARRDRSAGKLHR